jgi:hypothetical protein
MACMFGDGPMKKPLEGVAITSFAPMPPVQTLEP